ncbi:MAG: pyruvate:ferredoxin (flavodoxin) oxidoreductase [Peptococcaceae bacterium]|jgi:pyruvate-ferredoxin/flavodoxin oxidoreductase|nr:pyruvate:ferredoxin (flavodoxin) oxidoreductase [Peptococcaceae bacterium]
MAKTKTMDGNEAAAYASYAFTEVAAIYPITPSSTMAELVDEWSAFGKKNLFGQKVKVVEMQSEAGAAGAVHGSLQSGALTTTYTASQGLLLMIPNMYKIAGELLPSVFHVSARALAAHALSIFGDHQDVMAVRQTGFAMLASSNVQEAMDLGFVSHLSTLKGRVPFVHFFDGFRTSHEIQKVSLIDYEDIQGLVDTQALQEFKARALNPEHPVLRGSAQNADIYFQGKEASNRFYDAIPDIVENYMQEIKKITGREYHPFTYYGAPDAENIIVAMGSACETISEVVDYQNARGEKVGVLIIHLYRPFSAKYFFNVLPKTVKKIAVLDRTKEPGSLGEPLYLDITSLFYENAVKPLVVGGRYGLGSKDVTPADALAVFNNLKLDVPKNHFTLGIVDDVTHTSLPKAEDIQVAPEGTIGCKFWGLGSDGTVGANKEAIKIIGDHTDLNSQAYFHYDSKKSGGITVSHLRFGKEAIRSPYLITEADYVAVHHTVYIYQYDVLKGLKKNGTFVLNCPWTVAELEEKLPASVKRYIAKNQINFQILNAVAVAKEAGLGGRVNMIMQTVFFKLANVIPVDEAIAYLKTSVEKAYGKKGPAIVEKNHKGIDGALQKLIKVEVPAAWANAKDEAAAAVDEPAFIKNILRPVNGLEGDNLPVSAFVGMEDGTLPTGTAAYEKRGIAVTVPEWQADHCIQCNQCAFVCPHAAIRPFLVNPAEAAKAPASFTGKKATGKEFSDLQYRIQVSPLDCTGCGNCTEVCLAKEKALVMKPADSQVAAQKDNWEFAVTLSNKGSLVSPSNVKNSQFAQPLFEFNGACAGCGESAYVKLLTQLFGDRMMVANATGCSSIYSGSYPSVPYTVNAEGKGPSWANSLFEDNAEFGLGMYLGVKQQREKLTDLIQEAVTTSVSAPLKEAFTEWLSGKEDVKASEAATAKILPVLKSAAKGNALLTQIEASKDQLIKKSQWIIGGDGWAYDIGYGGLDHVLASGENINILVMDTEVYSNTGGQSSKSTPLGAVAKFQTAGKRVRKKDLGMMAMSYGYVYVAQVCMGSNMAQVLKAFQEAEAYDGPSLVIAYAPCINHGISVGMNKSILEAKKAVEAGYWHLFRYNPALIEQGANPFTLDSKEATSSFQDFILGEVRYASLKKLFPDAADELFKGAEENANIRYQSYKRLADQK